MYSNSDNLDDLLHISHSSKPTELRDDTDIYRDSQGRGTRFWQPHFEALPQERSKPKPSDEETPIVKLAQLPEGLKHVFLGVGETFPVIISSKLDATQE